MYHERKVKQYFLRSKDCDFGFEFSPLLSIERLVIAVNLAHDVIITNQSIVCIDECIDDSDVLNTIDSN